MHLTFTIEDRIYIKVGMTCLRFIYRTNAFRAGAVMSTTAATAFDCDALQTTTSICTASAISGEQFRRPSGRFQGAFVIRRLTSSSAHEYEMTSLSASAPLCHCVRLLSCGLPNGVSPAPFPCPTPSHLGMVVSQKWSKHLRGGVNECSGRAGKLAAVIGHSLRRVGGKSKPRSHAYAGGF
jgi:hypothetical protein